MASSSNATSDEPSSDQIAGCSFDGARAHTRRTGYFWLALSMLLCGAPARREH